MAFQHLRSFLNDAKASGLESVSIKSVERLLDIEEKVHLSLIHI